jgi:hypothetical protein
MKLVDKHKIAVATRLKLPASIGAHLRSVILFCLLPAASLSAAQATLTWTDNSFDETGFIIQRNDNGAGFVQIATVGAGVVTYVDATVVTGEQYSYRVCAYNSAGNSAFTNIVSDAPTFVTQPVNATSLAGGTTNFSVTVSGAPLPTFQWQVSTDGGGTWNNISNTAPYSNTTTDTLTITGVTMGLSANQYQCVASNGVIPGSPASSGAGLLTVGTIPSFTTQPTNQSAATGTSVSFGPVVATSTGVPTPTYQWQMGGVNLTDGVLPSGATVSGSATATLTLTGFSAIDAGTFDVVATNSLGSIPSNTVSLSVTGSSAPIITDQPTTSQSVGVGGTVILNVIVAGTPTPTVQWKLGSASLSNGGSVSGATSTTLVLTGIGTANAGSYTVVASNGVGSPATSNAAVVNVTGGTPPPPPPPTNIAPSISGNPSSQSVLSGSNVSFTVSAGGTPSPSYQWYFNGAAIQGATSSTLSLTGVTTASAGTYSVQVTNSAGTATSSGASLTVSIPSRIVDFSTRTVAGPGADTLIEGFVVSGGSKSLLMRAVGPGLIPIDPSLAGSVLTNPELVFLHGPNVLETNSGWGGTTALINAFASVGAFSLPSTSLDAAILTTVPPDAYTVQVPTSSSGIVLAEIYDADASQSPAGHLINVSTRANVGSGSGVLILGFVISGDTPVSVLIRAVGPELSSEFGLSEALPDPQIDLYQGSTLIQHNENWGGGPALTAAFADAGAFPLTSPNDSAMLATLPAGVYSVVVSGVSGDSGLALAEVFVLP